MPSLFGFRGRGRNGRRAIAIVDEDENDVTDQKKKPRRRTRGGGSESASAAAAATAITTTMTRTPAKAKATTATAGVPAKASRSRTASTIASSSSSSSPAATRGKKASEDAATSSSSSMPSSSSPANINEGDNAFQSSRPRIVTGEFTTNDGAAVASVSPRYAMSSSSPRHVPAALAPPLPNGYGGSPGNCGGSVSSTGCESGSDDVFTSAFTRSPPSFDKFDSDVLGDGGVFPVRNDGADDDCGWGDGDRRGPWDDDDDDVGNDDRSRDCTERSADPPAILMLEDDDDYDGDVKDTNVKCVSSSSSSASSSSSDPAGANGWRTDRAMNVDDGGGVNAQRPPMWRTTIRNKSRRLVSPSPSRPAVEGDDDGAPEISKSLTPDDDDAWGGGVGTDPRETSTTVPTGSSQYARQSSSTTTAIEDAFGTFGYDQFFGGGFGNINDADGEKLLGGGGTLINDDGFPVNVLDDDQDAFAFFGDSWLDVEMKSHDRRDIGNDDVGVGHAEDEADPFRSGMASSASSFVNDDSFGHSLSMNAPMDHAARAAVVAREPTQPSSMEDGGRALSGKRYDRLHLSAFAVQEPSNPQHTDQQQHQQQHQQQQKKISRQGLPPPRIVSERKASQGSVRSNNKVSSGNSVGSSRNRKSGGGGGSVGSNKSNSSAVDQILEHYRKKRRDRDRATTNNGGRVTPSSTSSQSGSQFSITTGSSPGSGSFAPSPGTASSGSFSASPGTVMSDVGLSFEAGATIDAGTESSVIRNRFSSESQRAPQVLRSAADLPHPCNNNHGRDSSTVDSMDQLGNTSMTHVSSSVTPSLEIGINRPQPAEKKNGLVSTTPQEDDAADYLADHQFLLSNIEATIGPRGVAPDMESLNGRSLSSVRSARDRPPTQYSTGVRRMGSGSGSSTRAHGGSVRSNTNRPRTVQCSDVSVDSRTSRGSRASHTSFRTYQSTRSALTSMSKETRSVANDLFRLEAQLADQVARQKVGPAAESSPQHTHNVPSIQLSLTNMEILGAEPVPRPNTHFTVVAPPGKLGVLLSNPKSSSGPTHVSAVRSTSVLAGKVHVGDIFISIDGENVTQMNSKEITKIMAQKNKFERVLLLRPPH